MVEDSHDVYREEAHVFANGKRQMTGIVFMLEDHVIS